MFAPIDAKKYAPHWPDPFLGCTGKNFAQFSNESFDLCPSKEYRIA